MPFKTLLQLRQDSRRAAALTADSDAVPDLTLNEYINQAWHELYDLIIDADDARIFGKNMIHPVEIGPNSYKLVSDFYRLISCDVRRGSQYVPAQRADPAEMAQLADNVSNYGRPQYYLRWDINIGEWHIFVYPKPGTEMLSITYFPTPKVLSLDADSLSNPASWLSFVSYGAAIKMLNQLERDPSAQMIELKKLGQRIEDSVNDLDMNSPAVIRDTDGRFGGHSGGWGYY
jgi:hypothetical protein